MGDLAGVVDHVAGDHRLLASGGDVNAHMTRRVARGGLEPNLVVDAVVLGHQHRLACIEDGLDRVLDDWPVLLLLDAPVVPLRLGKEVVGVLEGGHPAVIDQARVPAHVIDVQVGAHHLVHPLKGEAGGGEVVEKTPLHPVPSRIGALLAVADAGVHHQGFATRLNNQRVNAQHQPLPIIDEWLDPRQPVHLLRGRLRQQVRPQRGGGQLHDLGDLHIANPPLQHATLHRPAPSVSAAEALQTTGVKPS